MWKKDNIQAELQEISPALVGIKPLTPYRVEESYFKIFPELVLQKIRSAEMLAPGFDAFSKKDSYTVPAGYFDGLAGNILAKVKASTGTENEIANELAAIAPALARISRRTPYAVPAGYFDNLQVKPATAPAKVITMQSRVAKVFQYAVAAVIIAIMVISGYIFFDKPEITTPSGEINVTAEVDKLSDEEIMQYLSEHSTGLDGGNTGFIIPNSETNFEEIIDELSDQELQQFLKQYPEPASTGNRGI